MAWQRRGLEEMLFYGGTPGRWRRMDASISTIKAVLCPLSPLPALLHPFPLFYLYSLLPIPFVASCSYTRALSASLIPNEHHKPVSDSKLTVFPRLLPQNDPDLPPFPHPKPPYPKSKCVRKLETRGIDVSAGANSIFEMGESKSHRGLSGFWRLRRIAHNQLATSNDDRRCLNSIEIEAHDCRREENKSWERCFGRFGAIGSGRYTLVLRLATLSQRPITALESLSRLGLALANLCSA
ncbi:hypothetical protein V8C35DRAFT_304275 [Trichoderma chlorosporum]